MTMRSEAISTLRAAALGCASHTARLRNSVTLLMETPPFSTCSMTSARVLAILRRSPKLPRPPHPPRAWSMKLAMVPATHWPAVSLFLRGADAAGIHCWQARFAVGLVAAAALGVAGHEIVRLGERARGLHTEPRLPR